MKTLRACFVLFFCVFLMALAGVSAPALSRVTADRIPCMPYEKMRAFLSVNHGESRFWMARVPNGVEIIAWRNGARGWTLVSRLPSGSTCILMSGLQNAPPQPSR